MSKSIENTVKRMKQEARIAKAYAMTIEFKNMVENDASVKKFFEQFKK
jgi:predicted phage-related endonuclease